MYIVKGGSRLFGPSAGEVGQGKGACVGGILVDWTVLTTVHSEMYKAPESISNLVGFGWAAAEGENRNRTRHMQESRNEKVGLSNLL